MTTFTDLTIDLPTFMIVAGVMRETLTPLPSAVVPARKEAPM